jgi:hypothetical protein
MPASSMGVFVAAMINVVVFTALWLHLLNE